MRRPYVVYWNNIPSPYMVERFNAVASRGNLRFEAWFNDRIEPGRSWEVAENTWLFSYRYLPTVSIAGRHFHIPTLVLGPRPDVLVSLYAEPAFLLGWAVSRLRGTKTAFWCQVTYDAWVVRRKWKELAKRCIFPLVHATLGSGEESRAFAMRYGTKPERALRLRHSIDVAHFAAGSAKARKAREALRSSLNLRGVTFIYVGRLWWGKGLQYLLDAFEALQRMSKREVSLLLVGDGDEEQQLRAGCASRGIRNVCFAGFIQKEEMPAYYAASDVFVFPTLGDPYGLVVDEAMACGLPVISTSAAGEIAERVNEGINGFIVPPRNSSLLAERMIYLAENEDARRAMGLTSSKMIAGHTPDRWAADFEHIVLRLLRGL